MSHGHRNSIIVGLSLALTGCWGISGNGHRERETRDLSDFTGIENQGELVVEVREADDFRVTVSIDSNLIDHVKTRVRDHRLIIDNNINLLDKVSGPHVLVDMPHLTYVHLTGSGDLDARIFDESETLRLELRGSGDLTFEGSAPRIEATLNGSGDLHVSGTTDFLDAETNGSGSVEARDLEAGGGRLRSDGSGDIVATIHGEVDADLNGSGDLDLYGDVNVGRRSVEGSGDIRVHTSD